MSHVPDASQEESAIWARVQEQLAESFEIRNRLVGKGSLREAAEEGLAIVREKLNAQSASLFLFNKDGQLARKFLVGVDAHGQQIPEDWYTDEVCDPETSFTWKAVVCAPDAKYGAPQLAKNLDLESISSCSRDLYFSKLGRLTSAIALPLNGMFRTFGVLEVVNRLDPENPAAPFTEEDVYWASVIGISVANAISNIRRRVELDLVATVASLIAAPSEDRFKREKVFQRIAETLVGPDLHFRGSVIRVMSRRDGSLRVVGKASDGLSWENWQPNHPHLQDSITWQVVRTNRSECWSDIGEIRDRLANWRWFERNGIIAYAVLPLSVGDHAVGSLSVFATYAHKISASELRHLETIASLIATLAESSRVLDELAETSHKLEEYARTAATDAHIAARSRAGDEITRYRHQLKNDLTDALIGLDSTKKSGYKRTQAIDRLIVQFSARLTAVENEIGASAGADQRVAVDVNQIAREVTNSMAPTVNGQAIQIRFDPGPDLPLILVVQEELRHIVLNLILNSVRAIQKKGERKGEIRVSTGINRDRGIEYIELKVKDNGCGIPKEHSERIYEEGFTTYTQGTGLGLYTARKSVIRYGGRISFVSTVGKGTEFIVRFPWRQLRPKSKGGS